jgi:hypothetical protein
LINKKISIEKRIKKENNNKIKVDLKIKLYQIFENKIKN